MKTKNGCIVRLCICAVLLLLLIVFARGPIQCAVGERFEAAVSRLGQPQEVWPSSRKTTAMWVFDNAMGPERMFVDFKDGIAVHVEWRSR